VAETVCILGAAGFVGARALRRFTAGGCRVRVLAHRREVPANVDIVRGAADDAGALERALVPDCVVLNFVYGGADDARRIAQAIGAACARRKVRRLVHISSIDVYGATPGTLIDERSPCQPETEYQRAKHACEEIVAAAARSAYELVILRPAAVFGPGGRNLESLALRTLGDAWPRRYLRACVMGRRRMHVVDVECVAAAAQWAASAPLAEAGERFIVSQDDEPQNEYAALEAFFAERFGRSRYPLPPVPLPGGLHRLALRLAGRSDAEPRRRYSGAKLAARGFAGPRPMAEALDEYAAWIRQRIEG
jgi:nucleoside-diphosphate-sugar epimerase